MSRFRQQPRVGHLARLKRIIGYLANQSHDQVTGRAVTACLHLVNATHIHWITKRHATVETATYGSEFIAARIVTDQIIDLRHTLMYLGVPIRAKSYIFGDNKSVLDSTNMSTSTLSKKSTLASDHRMRSHSCRISPIQLEGWKIQPCRHLEQTLGVCKYLATLETSTLLERRCK